MRGGESSLASGSPRVGLPLALFLVFALAANTVWLAIRLDIINSGMDTAQKMGPLKPGIASQMANTTEFPATPLSDIFKSNIYHDDNQEGRWHRLKEILCPDMRPNHKVHSVLFELARTELGFAYDRIPTKPKDRQFVAKFFTATQGALAYSSPDKKSHLVYLKVWKAGNDLIRTNLEAALSSKGSLWQGTGNPLWSRIPKHRLNQTCVVTAVRDPVSHFLSGYNEMETRVMLCRDEEERKRRGQFCVGRASHLWGRVPFANYAIGTTARFRAFVQDFVGGAASTGLYPSTPAWNIFHVFSMTGALMELAGKRNSVRFFYLPSIEALDENFPKFLARSCKGIPPEAGKPFQIKYVHPSQEDDYGFYDAAKSVWKEQDAISRALCAIHAMDYACFEAIPIPVICQSVFLNQTFLDKLAKAAAT